MSEKGKITRGRLGSLSLKKEGERQCFLFSKHLIICTRGSGGKLHLTKVGERKIGQMFLAVCIYVIVRKYCKKNEALGLLLIWTSRRRAKPHREAHLRAQTYTLLYLQNGVVSLIDCTLMEDPEGTDDECECSVHFTLAEIYACGHVYNV